MRREDGRRCPRGGLEANHRLMSQEVTYLPQEAIREPSSGVGAIHINVRGKQRTGYMRRRVKIVQNVCMSLKMGEAGGRFVIGAGNVDVKPMLQRFRLGNLVLRLQGCNWQGGSPRGLLGGGAGRKASDVDHTSFTTLIFRDRPGSPCLG